MTRALPIVLMMLILAQAVGASDIFEAAKKGDTDALRVLLANDPSILNSKDKEGNTPIFHAVAGEQVKTVRFLLAKGSKVTATDTDGVTPLHVAAVVGNAIIAKLLLDSGANIDAVTIQGITPLHWSAYYGSNEVAQVLIKYGAALNAREKTGNTPLHMAMRMRISLSKDASGKTQAQMIVNDKVALLLLENGAELNPLNQKGQTPLDFAIEQLNTPLVELLRKRGARTKDDLKKP